MCIRDSLWSYTANNDSLRLHHDFTVTPQGNVIAICWEVLDSLECIENGRDPQLLETGELWSDKLIELQPDGMGGVDIVWEWRAWDHLVQDFDSTKANYGVVADNQSLIDLNYGSPRKPPEVLLGLEEVLAGGPMSISMYRGRDSPRMALRCGARRLCQELMKSIAVGTRRACGHLCWRTFWQLAHRTLVK